MIRVQIDRKKDDQSIQAFAISGHAEFAEHGKDIVCAGVSAVSVGTVNAAEAVLGVHLHTSMQSGNLEVRVPEGLEPKAQEQLQVILESMVVMLDSIQQSYGKYIKIQQANI